MSLGSSEKQPKVYSNQVTVQLRVNCYICYEEGVQLHVFACGYPCVLVPFVETCVLPSILSLRRRGLLSFVSQVLWT